MKVKPVPFSFLPPPLLKKVSHPFLGLGSNLLKGLPFLALELEQAEIGWDADEYGAAIVFQFLFYFVLISALFFLVSLRWGSLQSAIVFSPTAGAIISVLIALQLIVYPKIIVKKKVKNLEQSLGFALRTLLIQLRSGVSLFDSLSTVSQGEFGTVSKEFRKAVEEISTGALQEEVLQKLAMKNPSWFFRRSLWQIVNGLKTGGDISNVLNEIVVSLARDESIQIREYGSSLRFLSMLYMLLGVIIPALGITFLIIISSFPQIEVTELMFFALLVVIIVGQLMFLGLLKSKRPTLVCG